MSLLGRITSFIKTDILGIEETNNTQKSGAVQPHKEAIIQCNTDKPEDTFKNSGKTSRKAPHKGMSLKAAEDTIANTPSEKFNIRQMLKDGLLEKIFGEAGSKDAFDKLTPEQQQLVIRAIQFSIAKFEKMMKDGELSPDTKPEALIAESGKILYNAISSGSFKTIEEFETASQEATKVFGSDYDKQSSKKQIMIAKKCRKDIDREMQAELDATNHLPKEQREVVQSRIIKKYRYLKQGIFCHTAGRFGTRGALNTIRILNSDDINNGMQMLISSRINQEEKVKAADMADYGFTKDLIRDYKEFGDEIKPASLKAYTATAMSYKSTNAATEYQANYKADRDVYEAALIKQRNGEALTEDEKNLLSIMSSEYYTATAQGIGEGALNNVNMTTEEKANFLNQWEEDAKQYSDYEAVVTNIKEEMETNPQHTSLKEKIKEIAIENQAKTKSENSTRQQNLSHKENIKNTTANITIPIENTIVPKLYKKEASQAETIKSNVQTEANVTPIIEVKTSNPIKIAQEIKTNGIQKAIRKHGCEAIQIVLDNSAFKHLRSELTTIIRSYDLKSLLEITANCSDSSFVFICSVINKDFIEKLTDNREHTKGLCFAANNQIKNIEGER